MELEYIDIFHALQYAVDKIAKARYSKDTCPPKFIISQYERKNLEDKVEAHEILLTVEHAGQKRSRAIFPRLHYSCGYESLADEMKWLYNSTM